MKTTELSIYEGYKVGDKVTIKRKPYTWSSSCNSNCALHADYPFTGTITKIAFVEIDAENHIAAEIGDYGFSLSGLIKEKIIAIQ